MISLAVHPGYTDTNLQQNGPSLGGKSFLSRLYRITNKVVAQDITMGVLPMLYAMTMDDVNGGDYLGPKIFSGMRGYTRRIKSNKASYDKADAKQLWNISEELTGIKYQF
ncbi:MAG: hypothetical protein OEZ01_04480 [Candidatus Heimdallarchaeota archaeon]|nr:hypothetical protein [Candidatus Heimdallarchaeota archaeon]MDH5645237.1 hypothetical protein [Candidatus Heimdallarchaeota archaeon]